MSKLYYGGIKLPTGFMPVTNNPIDDRFAVDTFVDLATLKEYTGLLTYVRDEATYYHFTGAIWEILETGGGTSLPDELSLNGFELSIVGSNTVDLTHSHTMSDITDLAFPVTSVNNQIGDILLGEVDIKGNTQTNNSVTGSFTVDYLNYSQCNIELIGNTFLNIVPPDLEEGESVSRLLHIKLNGNTINFPPSMATKMVGFQFIDVDTQTELWVVTRYVGIENDEILQFSNLTVFPFTATGGGGSGDCNCNTDFDVDGGNAYGNYQPVNPFTDGGSSDTTFVNFLDNGNAGTDLGNAPIVDGGKANTSF